MPRSWDDFIVPFLAQQDQACTGCKQGEDETTNQFIAHLRSLRLEQKASKKEHDFTEHIFCKMRPDTLNLMNSSRPFFLKNVTTETQKVEEILCVRNEEH